MRLTEYFLAEGVVVPRIHMMDPLGRFCVKEYVEGESITVLEAPLETAEAYHHLIDEFGMTHEEVAVRVGKSREAVTNTHRLVKLPDAIKKGLVTKAPRRTWKKDAAKP